MWRKVAVIAGATLLSIGVLELGVRLLLDDPSARIHFAVKSAGCCRLDPRLLWTFEPGATGSWGTDEFTETVHINSLGLRGAEIPPRREGELRILAAGDSFTYGHGMSDDDAYPAVLQGMLRSHGYPVLVLNAGQPGYGADQTYRAIVERWLALAPSLVVVGIHCSDVGHDADVSLYDVRDGALIELPTDTSWVRLQGKIYVAMPRPIRSLRLFQHLVGTLDRADPYGRLPRHDEAARNDWLRTKIVLELRDLVERGKAAGFAVVAVIMPCKQDLVGGDRAIYGDLRRRLADAGVSTIDAGAEMRARGVAGQQVFFARDWHLNKEGNWLLAEIVAKPFAAALAGRSTAARSAAAPAP